MAILKVQIWGSAALSRNKINMIPKKNVIIEELYHISTIAAYINSPETVMELIINWINIYRTVVHLQIV